MEKPKKSLTPEEIETLFRGLKELQRDVREIMALLQARLGEKPA